MRTYESKKPISREETADAFSSSDKDKICDALLRLALFSPDWQSVQADCLRFLRHPEADVRGVAITCLGHLARIHRVIDYAVVMEALQSIITDPEVGGRAQDALDDIRTYVHREQV